MQNLDASEHLAAADVVDKCIVLASSSGQSCQGHLTVDGPADQINKDLSQYVARYENKMVGFAFINPLTEGRSVRNLKSSTEKLGLKGIVLYCSHSAFHPADTRAMQLYESAQELYMPVFFHNTPVGTGGFLEYARPFLLDEVARAFPDLKIIVGGMGFPFYEQTLCLLAKHQNVYADLSVRPGKAWQVYNIVVSAYEQGVMDKLFFGTPSLLQRPRIVWNRFLASISSSLVQTSRWCPAQLSRASSNEIRSNSSVSKNNSWNYGSPFVQKKIAGVAA